tara:strand:- start:7270 stop:7452 length:183 start_codon:yes stop_codon:yes gene_type:complete
MMRVSFTLDYRNQVAERLAGMALTASRPGTCLRRGCHGAVAKLLSQVSRPWLRPDFSVFG